ncbi:MAG: family 20 glycosylhydrolase [Phycisphaerae bacterium]
MIEHNLLPRPRRVRPHGGIVSLPGEWRIEPEGENAPDLAAAIRQLRRIAPPHLHLTRRKTGRSKTGTTRSIRLETRSSRHGAQWYQLRIRGDRIVLRAAGPAGFRYAVLTLGQLLATDRPAIRAMDIEDWPDFPVRGVMLDISRDKIPTIRTLHRLIDRLAGWKINQVQLYMEHTFAYAGHEEVWRGASPLTGVQVRALDHFCRERGIELVPNQNSLGHMERWLRHRRYAPLAECAGPWRTPWGEVRHRPTTLCPMDPQSVRLMASLYEQLLPNFSSSMLNVGCDEPWELGQGRSRSSCRRRGAGRVYLEYLRRIHRLVRRSGRRMMCWSDWIEKYPELFADLPGDVIPLVWGYEAEHPFGRVCARCALRALDFYVCPGTSSWCSFGGRTNNAHANLKNAAISGRRYGAGGYLITDWGDCGHRQYLPVSYAGFLYGAALGWCVSRNADIDVASELDRHVFQDPSGHAGAVWLDAGRVHEDSHVLLNNRTVLFECMQSPLDSAAGVEGLSADRVGRMCDRVADLKTRALRVRIGGEDGPIVKDELIATIAVLNHACRRAAYMVSRREGVRPRTRRRWLAADMERILERHRSLWRKRNRPGGLGSSLAYYRRNLVEYRGR